MPGFALKNSPATADVDCSTAAVGPSSDGGMTMLP